MRYSWPSSSGEQPCSRRRGRRRHHGRPSWSSTSPPAAAAAATRQSTPRPDLEPFRRGACFSQVSRFRLVEECRRRPWGVTTAAVPDVCLSEYSMPRVAILVVHTRRHSLKKIVIHGVIVFTFVILAKKDDIACGVHLRVTQYWWLNYVPSLILFCIYICLNSEC